MRSAAQTAVEYVQSVIAAILSWIVLAAISIIISGILIAKRLPIGLPDSAKFVIPLGIFHLKATGEEVIVGFCAFIISLVICIFVGGHPAYEFFKIQAGIDIGQWNSLCVMASFLSLIVSTIICIAVPFLKSAPLISEADRATILTRLSGGDNA